MKGKKEIGVMVNAAHAERREAAKDGMLSGRLKRYGLNELVKRTFKAAGAKRMCREVENTKISQEELSYAK